jgi:hypothetical protein
MSLECFQATTIRLKVLGDLGDASVPFKRIEEHVSKHRMVSGLIEINDLSQDGCNW